MFSFFHSKPSVFFLFYHILFCLSNRVWGHLLKNKAIQYRFMSDAEREGITYGDNVKPTERKVDDIMALQPNGTICFLGWAGRMCYHYNKENVLRIDYERYIDGAENYII